MPIFLLLLVATQALSVFSQAAESESGVILNFQINGYSNPSAKLPNGNACICPKGIHPPGSGRSRPNGYNCTYLTVPSMCYIKFKITAVMEDLDIRVIRTNYFALDADGNLPQQSKDDWNGILTMQVPKIPLFVEVFSHNLGSVITADGKPEVAGSESKADQFHIPIKNMLSSSTNNRQNANGTRYEGEFWKTLLFSSFSVTCLGSLTGPLCDLKCITPRNKNDSAHCVSVETGDFWQCKHILNEQVNQCEMSSWEAENKTREKHDREEKCVREQRQFNFDEWKTISMAIGILLLFVVLAFLLGFEVSRRRVMDSKEEKVMKPVFCQRCYLI